jgi:hypothetical protein
MVEPGYIDPDALYDEPTIRLNLGITSGALQKARKAGELRFTRRGGKTRYFGRWLIAWLSGEPVEQSEPAHAVAS